MFPLGSDVVELFLLPPVLLQLLQSQRQPGHGLLQPRNPTFQNLLKLDKGMILVNQIDQNDSLCISMLRRPLPAGEARLDSRVVSFHFQSQHFLLLFLQLMRSMRNGKSIHIHLGSLLFKPLVRRAQFVLLKCGELEI